MKSKFDINVACAVAEIFKAIAHPVRLQILDTLGDQEKCVSEIVDEIGILQSGVSQHLGLMRDKGVVSSRRESRRVYYRIANPNVLSVLGCIYDNCETIKD